MLLLLLLLAFVGCSLDPLSRQLDAADAATGDDLGEADGTVPPQDGGGELDTRVDRDTKSPDARAPCSSLSTNLDTVHEPGQKSSIAVGPDGVVHISHYAAGRVDATDWHDARYTSNRSGDWASEDIATSGVIGAYTALGLDQLGRVHVVFLDFEQQDLLYSWRDGTRWHPVERIDTEGAVGGPNDLAVDATSTVHVVTYRTSDGAMRYLFGGPGGWAAPRTLAPWAGKGQYPGIAVDDDVVYISYCDHLGNLQFLVGEGIASGGDFATAIPLDSGIGPVDCNVKLAIDSDGDIHVAYYHTGQKALHYVGQSSGVFGAPIALDSNGNVGRFLDIVAIGTDLAIAYWDETNVDLKLIERRQGSWGSPDTVDSAGEVGGELSLAAGPDGSLHVSHYNMTEMALRYTRICR